MIYVLKMKGKYSENSPFNPAASQIFMPKGNQLHFCVFFQPDYMYIYSSQYSAYICF